MPFLCNASSLHKLRKHPMFTVTFTENLDVLQSTIVPYLLILNM